MATGETLLVYTAPMPEKPTSNFSTPDKRNVQWVEDFDAATQETLYVRGVLPRNYGGGGITVRLGWMATSATSGVCRWTVGWERHDTATDRDADSFATDNTVDSTAAGTSGYTVYADIAFTNGAQIDSLAVGEGFRLRVGRAAAHANDTMTGDAELASIEIRET